MVKKNNTAMIIAIIAGLLLLISGISGITTWENIQDIVTEHIIDNYMIGIVFAILIFIASLGGISVIIGGILIGKEKIGIGKFFITLGAGIGLIGLIFSIIVTVLEGSFTLGSYFSIGAIGLILSIIARMITKKEK
jgi:hypothetical protein